MKITKEELIAKLKELKGDDPESGHMDADEALLDFIDDIEVTEAFKAILRWYA